MNLLHSAPSIAAATSEGATAATGAPAAELLSPAVNWHLTIAYQGTAWHGWQIQPECPTVQGELESRLRRIFADDSIRTAGTSRTDAGVHALDQHVTFTTAAPAALSAADLKYRLNRWLPASIRVLNAEFAAPDFHARHSAKAKAYTYTVALSHEYSPFIAPFVWQYGRDVDLPGIRSALQELCGTHDFASFAANPHREIDSTVRTIHRFEVCQTGGLLFFNVIGDSFLYKMVRTLVGYAVLHAGTAAGGGKAAARDILAARQRSADVQTAPAEGLAKVFFAENEWQTYQPLQPPFAWQASAEEKSPVGNEEE